MMSDSSLHAHLELHLSEASILVKMCVTHLINLDLEGGGASAPLAPPPHPTLLVAKQSS